MAENSAVTGTGFACVCNNHVANPFPASAEFLLPLGGTEVGALSEGANSAFAGTGVDRHQHLCVFGPSFSQEVEDWMDINVDVAHS